MRNSDDGGSIGVNTPFQRQSPQEQVMSPPKPNRNPRLLYNQKLQHPHQRRIVVQETPVKKSLKRKFPLSPPVAPSGNVVMSPSRPQIRAASLAAEAALFMRKKK